eukprot:327534-Rhodomonas_salina.3
MAQRFRDHMPCQYRTSHTPYAPPVPHIAHTIRYVSTAHCTPVRCASTAHCTQQYLVDTHGAPSTAAPPLLPASAAHSRPEVRPEL